MTSISSKNVAEQQERTILRWWNAARFAFFVTLTFIAGGAVCERTAKLDSHPTDSFVLMRVALFSFFLFATVATHALLEAISYSVRNTHIEKPDNSSTGSSAQ